MLQSAGEGGEINKTRCDLDKEEEEDEKKRSETERKKKKDSGGTDQLMPLSAAAIAGRQEKNCSLGHTTGIRTRERKNKSLV